MVTRGWHGKNGRAAKAGFTGHTQQARVVRPKEPIRLTHPKKGTRTVVLKEARKTRWVPKGAGHCEISS